MGNEFAKPSSKNILNHLLFAEITDAKLSDLIECSDFLGRNKDNLNQAQFEDTFGVLFKDPDPHFAVFEKNAVESQIATSLREEDSQPDGTVNPFVVCTIIALLSKDSVDKKFSYLYDLHFDNEKDLEENIKFMTDCFVKGILALFKVQKMPPRHMQHASVINSLKTMRHSQRLQNERDEVESDEDVLTLSDFFQLCQESQVISKLLNATLQLCSKQQVVQTHAPTSNIESKLVSSEGNKVDKVCHPLWNFHILDMFNESWLSSTPQVSNARTVSSCIELFLYSGKAALPVYFNSKTPVFDAADASLITYDKKKKVMRVSELEKTDTDGKEEDGFDSDSYQLQGIIDEFTIMMWFAECCPASITEKSKIERKSVVEIKGGRRRSSIAPRSRGDSSMSSIGSQGRTSLMFAMPQLGGRNRRTSFNSAIGSQWRDMGLKFAGSTIHTVLKDFSPNPNARKGYKSNFECVLVKIDPQDSPEEDTDSIDVKEKSKTMLRCELGYSVHDIFQTDQFMYNVVEMVARGYRNIPLAASRVRPYSVSHIVPSVEVASFLRLYSKECLGTLASSTIVESGLMKVPLVVSCDLNYGSAIQHLKQFKVDTAAIIDSEGRWVGRLDCSSAAVMWWRWRNLSRGLIVGDQEELDGLKEAFADERYEELDVSSIKNYSAYSMMMNPLGECSSIGVKLYDFNEQFKSPAKKSLDEGDEDSESSTDASSSSSNDSDSDGSTSSSDSDSDSVFSGSDDDRDEGNKLGDGISKISMSTVNSQHPCGMPSAANINSVKDEERQAKLSHQRQFTNWLRNQGLLLEQDTIASALEVMSVFKTTKAFVVNSFGEVIGVVSIRSIAIEILKYENKMQKANYQLAVQEDKEDD